jgi:hypothetical protein
MSRQRYLARLTRLEHRHVVPIIPPGMIRRLATTVGVSEAELLEEAEDLARRCRDAGAVTHEARMRLVADDLGISVEELEADVAAMEVSAR